MEQVQDLTAFLVIAGVTTISGHWLLRAAGLCAGCTLLDFALAGGSGLLFLASSTAVLAFLQLLWLPAWTVLILMSGAAFLLLRAGGPIIPGSETSKRSICTRFDCDEGGSLTGAERVVFRLLSALVVAHLLLSLAAALAPPTGVDPLIYHLAIPKIYLSQGGMEYLPSIYPSSWPLLIQMVFLFAQWLRGAEVAQLMNFWAVLLSCLVVYELAGGWKRRLPALLAVLLYLSISDVIYQSSVAMIDVMASLFLLLALGSLVIWLQWQQSRWLVLSAVLAGAFAAGRISNAGLVIALAVPLVLITLAERRPAERGLLPTVAPFAIFAILAFLVVLPWYLRSWWYTGNPVYPYLYGVFGGLNFSPQAAAYLDQLSFFKTVGPRSLTGFLTIPWEITIRPDRFRSGVIGPVLLSCLPLVFIYRRQLPSWTRLSALFVIAALPIWYLTYVRVRSLLPVLALLMILTAVAIARFLRDGKVSAWFKGIVAGTLVLWLGIGFMTNLYHHASAAAVATGLQDRADYLREKLLATGFEWIDDFQILNRQLPSKAKVLIWEDRGFYLERDYLWASGLWRGLASREELVDSEKLVEALERLGVTHLAWDRGMTASAELERLRRTFLTADLPTAVVYQSPRMEVRKILSK